MNKTYVSLVVLVLVAVGAFFAFHSKRLEAPATSGSNNTIVNNTNGMPTMTNPETPTPTPTPNPISPITPTNPTQPTPAASTTKEFTITGKNFSFTPNAITVKKGDKVKITFKNSAGYHDFKIDELGVASKQTNGPTEEVIEFTADKAGSFQYYCSVGNHRSMGMWGTLKVE